jgi:hypothetical protein
MVDFTASADEALARMWALLDRWRASVAAMTPEQLDTAGFGQYPWGSDPEEPFISVIWSAKQLDERLKSDKDIDAIGETAVTVQARRSGWARESMSGRTLGDHGRMLKEMQATLVRIEERQAS